MDATIGLKRRRVSNEEKGTSNEGWRFSVAHSVRTPDYLIIGQLRDWGLRRGSLRTATMEGETGQAA